MGSHNYEAAYAEGHKQNEVVGKFLREQGIACSVPELQIAERPEEWANFTKSEKDIILSNGETLEVKSINQDFTASPSSFPLRQIIVDTVSGFEGKDQKPIGYIFVSKKTGAMLALSTARRDKWWVENKYDRFRDKNDNFYFAAAGELRTMKSLILHLIDRQNISDAA